MSASQDQITYDHAQIAAETGGITQASTALETTLDDLKRSLQPLVSSWRGDAQTSYFTYQAEWDKAADALQMMLRSVARAASEGNEGMQGADRAAASMWH